MIYASLNAQVMERKVLRWAADAESGAPFVFQDPNNPSKYIGFEVDIIKAIAEEMGYDDQFIQVGWDGLIPGINNGNYDVAINGLEITPDRKESVEFSIPYYYTFEQLIIKADDNSITSLSSLFGKKAGTLKGSLAERILRAAEGIDVVTYDSETQSFQDLRLGRLDAVLIDEPVAKYYASWNPDLKLVNKQIDKVIYGIVIQQGNTELLQKVNNALQKIIDSGRLREIYESWNLWNPMMAAEFNDYTQSNVPPNNFDLFMETVTSNRNSVLIGRLGGYTKYLGLFAKAAFITFELTLFGMALAVIIGLFVALLRLNAPKPISFLAQAYVEYVRGTPLLLQLILIYYGLPQLGIEMNALYAGIIGLGINYSAYEAEIYRAGLLSVRRGQMEAAISLGMNKIQAMRHVVVPQAVRLVIPPVTNDAISMLKDSSIVSIIALTELTKQYLISASANYDYIELGIIVAHFYLILGVPFIILSRYLERKFSLSTKDTAKI